MSAGAKLYTVKGTYGTTHVIHDLGSGAFWSERTDEAARALAKEKGLTITEQRTMTRDEWLRLNGQEPMRVVPKKTTKPTESQAPEKPVHTPIMSRAKFDASWPAAGPLDLPALTAVPHDDSVIVKSKNDDAIVKKHQSSQTPRPGVFSRSGPAIPQEPVPSDLLTGRANLSPKSEQQKQF